VHRPGATDAPRASLPVLATASEGIGARPSSGGRITPAAAAAVAQIRRRRAASRAQDPAHLHASSSEAADAEADAAPASHSGIESQQQHDSRHADCGADAPGPSRHNDLPAGSSGWSLPATADAERQTLPAVREGLPIEREGLPAERLPSAPRPPLPFHPIRRSARLHKSAGQTLSGPLQQAGRDKDDAINTIADTAAAASAQVNAKADLDPAGPCTRSDTAVRFYVAVVVHASL